MNEEQVHEAAITETLIHGAVAQVYMSGEGETCVEFIIEETEHLPPGTLLYPLGECSKKIVAWLNPIGGDAISAKTKTIDPEHFSNYSVPLSISILDASASTK